MKPCPKACHIAYWLGPFLNHKKMGDEEFYHWTTDTKNIYSASGLFHGKIHGQDNFMIVNVPRPYGFEIVENRKE